MADDDTAGVLDLVAVVVVALLHRVEYLQTELKKMPYYFKALARKATGVGVKGYWGWSEGLLGLE